jgi:hypothetical protein
VMSPRVRANPGGLRFAGRRRNMPSKSTIPASLSLSRDFATRRGEFDSLAQHGSMDVPCPAKHPRGEGGSRR